MNKKTAIVFGATGGIGRAVVKQMIERGFFVCGVGLDAAKNERLRQELGDASLSLYQMDASDGAAVRLGLERIQREHHTVGSVVFSVSAPLAYRPFLKADWGDFSRHIDVQLKGLFNVVKGLEEQITKNQGIRFVILLTEACVGKPPAGMSGYVSAKYGLMGLAKCLAVELAKYQCTVNMVSPGMVQTDLIAGFPPKLIEMEAANNPLGRIAAPDDVAQTVVFLAGAEAGYLNGADIMINGGGKMS